jgi:predicted urease superfamily metal-dependent hydrolase
MSNPYDFVNSINLSKKDLMTGTDNDLLAEKGYVPFITNKALSYFVETILLTNEMNINHRLPNKLQFHYLINTCKKGRRFAKWIKKQDLDNLELVKHHYGYNNQKAQQVLRLLSPEQITALKECLEQGG